MKRLWWSAALLGPLWLVACGGDVSVAPAAPYLSIPGSPGLADPGTDPGTDPGPGPEPEPFQPAAVNGQMWSGANTTGKTWRVLVRDEFGFLGWWREDHGSGPPTYGIFRGDLQAPDSNGRVETTDMVVMQLPDHHTSIGNMGMGLPVAGESHMDFEGDASTVRALPLAHQELSMAQRSGRYAGELQLPGRREPVSLHWEADGRISLTLSHLPAADCGASGLAAPLAGAPARLLAVALSFTGNGCPQASTGVNLAGITVQATVDAESADTFVLFGMDGLGTLPLLLPASRASS